MLILSWNVAGLSKTVQRIHEAGDFSSASSVTEKPTGRNQSSFDAFLQRHQADIVCLQEHKVPLNQLKNRSEPRQCSSLENYESFWACSSNSTTSMNFGVVTFVRKGSCLRANAAPLAPDIDAQGRCIMTDHGSFVLFNVYVPASGGLPLAYKMRFLRALQRAMTRQRQERKVPVILVGDLNIALTSNDIYWKDRVVYIDSILQSTDQLASAQELPQWKKDIHTHWPAISAALETKQVVPTKTTNTHTGDQFDKYRLAVDVGDRRVYLGKHESTPEYCLYHFDFRETFYSDEETQEQIMAQESNAVRLQILAELMFRIVGVQWSEEALREIASTEATIQRVSPPRRWLHNLLHSENMVDAFRYIYPTAEGRFTCWHQFTNRRYVNDGSRIDATLVDRDLVPYIRKGNVESLRCGAIEVKLEDPLSEQAALEAATANGRFQPVSFEGGGIQDVTREALLTQFGEPHTGMVYTPPSFSDHIAISLLMEDSILPRDLTLEADAATRKAQPHKLQKSIAACFAACVTNNSPVTSKSQLLSRIPPANNKGKPISAAKKSKAAKPDKRPTNTLFNHFRKLEKK
jgi:exonuclease III